MVKKMLVNKFKKILENQKLEILSKVQAGQNLEIDMGSDDVDSVQANILALASSQLISRDREKLQKIEIALRKIKEGTYGTCIECGDDIAYKRLEFNAFLHLCISCAEHIEINSKIYSK